MREKFSVKIITNWWHFSYCHYGNNLNHWIQTFFYWINVLLVFLSQLYQHPETIALRDPRDHVRFSAPSGSIGQLHSPWHFSFELSCPLSSSSRSRTIMLRKKISFHLGECNWPIDPDGAENLTWSRGSLKALVSGCWYCWLRNTNSTLIKKCLYPMI